MKIRPLGLMVLLLAVCGMSAADITLADWGDLKSGGQFDIKMICRKTTDVVPVGSKDPYNWYGEIEKKLYTDNHDPDNGKMVYYVGSYEAPKVLKKGAHFNQDAKAAPAECRLYFVVRYP